MRREVARARADELRRTADVVAASLVPRWLPAEGVRSLARPLTIAAASTAAAVALGTAVALELARSAWGSALVAAAVAVVALLAPSARIVLGGPTSPALALARCASLLRSLDLGGATLARHAAIATAVPVIAPMVLLGGAAAAVLAGRGAPTTAIVVSGAVVLGGAAAVLLARRDGARLASGEPEPRPGAMAARRLAVVCAVGLVLLSAPVGAWHVAPAVITAAGLATATWIIGDVLVIDARPWLRLQVALIGCGASPTRTIARTAAAAVGATAVVGGAVGLGAEAASESGLRVGLAAAAIAVGSLTALALEPDPTAVLARGVALSLVLAPGVGSVLLLADAGWAALVLGVVAAAGIAALARRLA